MNGAAAGCPALHGAPTASFAPSIFDRIVVLGRLCIERHGRAVVKVDATPGYCAAFVAGFLSAKERQASTAAAAAENALIALEGKMPFWRVYWLRANELASLRMLSRLLRAAFARQYCRGRR
jgi:hypothetical protein